MKTKTQFAFWCIVLAQLSLISVEGNTQGILKTPILNRVKENFDNNWLFYNGNIVITKYQS